MGRLRGAIQTLADLEPEPDELLARIADLVQRLAAEAPPGDHDVVGATCLYAVYDPVTRRCAMASAGHPPPVLVRPDGHVEAADILPGPPLAVCGMPYETTTIDLEPGSVLALYTDGLVQQATHDVCDGLQRLTDALATSCRPDRALEETGRKRPTPSEPRSHHRRGWTRPVPRRPTRRALGLPPRPEPQDHLVRTVHRARLLITPCGHHTRAVFRAGRGPSAR
jgi:hypothetical protein